MDTVEGRQDPVTSPIAEILEQLTTNDVLTRSALLDKVAADDASLRDQIVQLLRTYDSGMEFFRRFPDLRQESADTPHQSRMFADGDVVVSRFRIRGFRGAGGLGEVYEVEDLQFHDVPIALKTVRASLSADEVAVKKLAKELLLARRISHPNVCRVHDVYQHLTAAGDRIACFTMELLEGETLALRLTQGAIPTAEALPILRQIAEGLDAAHAAGVAHGDLKPGNIMLVPTRFGRHRVVLTDFGLAALLPAGSTLVSTTIDSRRWGTPAYMAPEQLLGGAPTSASDIYSLGVVACEILTAQRPFTPAAPLLMALQKIRHVPHPHEPIPGVNPRWQAAIARCLDPDSARRFIAAKDFVRALDGNTNGRSWRFAAAVAIAVAAGTWAVPRITERNVAPLPTAERPAAVERKVAVLQFGQEEPTPEGDVLALGLTTALTDRLGSMTRNSPGLWVIPAREVIDTGVNTPALAEQTHGATLFLSARLSRVNGRMRIALGLNERSARGFGLNATRTIDGLPSDRGILDPVTQAASQLLGMKSGSSPRPAQNVRQLEAEHAYLMGLGFLAQGTQALAMAVDAFQRAVLQDDQSAAAYAGLAEAYLKQYDAIRDGDLLGRAQESVDQAIRLDPRDARFRVLRGLIYTNNGQAQRAVQELQDAVDLDPDAPGVLSSLAAAHEADGALDNAERTYRQAIGRHPTHWSAYEHLGIFLFRQGKYTEAEQNFVQATKFAPANPQAIRNLAAVYVIQERFAAAVTELVKATKLAPDASTYNTLGWVHVLEGKFDAAVGALEDAVKLPRAGSLIWSSLARAYRWAGGHIEAEQGAYARALAHANEELRLNPSNAEIRSNRAYLLAETGHSADALRELSRTLALRSAKDNVEVLFDAALIHEWSGNRTRALDYLYRAAQRGYSRSRIERNPDLKRLRSDPGYRRVLDLARPVPN